MKNLNENEFYDNIKFVRDLGSDDVAKYCSDSNYNKLIQLLATYTQRHENEIVVTNGGYHALRVIMNTLVGVDEEILVLCPNYPVYLDAKRSIKKVFYRKSGNNQEITIDYKDIIKNISDNTKLIYLSNPNNPLGIVHTMEEITNLLQNTPPDVYILIDEAYIEFSPSFSSSKLLDIFPNLIIVRTFSKAFGQAGVKLGYILGSGDIIPKLEQERGKFLSLSSVAIKLGIQKLENKNIMEDAVNKTIKQRESFLLNNNSKCIPGFGNFICIENSVTEKLSDTQKDHIKKLEHYPDIGDFGGYSRLTIGNR